MRKCFVAGNWKMNLSLAEAGRLVRGLKAKVGRETKVDVAVCPPFVYLNEVAALLKGCRIALGAQNMHPEPKGAFTGEVAASMLKNVKCTYVILGHSERRHVFGEQDKFINAKVKAALEAGLLPILCVGELLEERRAKKTKTVVRGQLKKGLAGVGAKDAAKMTVAYEPVWAIGTGVNATPEQAEEVHAYIRGLLEKMFGRKVAEAMRIQYGGSVKPGNAGDLMSQPNVDGALVGGASLKASTFVPIVRAALKR